LLREFFCGEASPFQRKSVTVSAQKWLSSVTVSAWITSQNPSLLWINPAYAFPQKGDRKKGP